MDKSFLVLFFKKGLLSYCFVRNPAAQRTMEVARAVERAGGEDRHRSQRALGPGARRRRG
jgi:hypothetical protein